MALLPNIHVNFQRIPDESVLRHLSNHDYKSLAAYSQRRAQTISIDVDRINTQHDIVERNTNAYHRIKEYPQDQVERRAKADDVEMLIELGLRCVPAIAVVSCSSPQSRTFHTIDYSPDAAPHKIRRKLLTFGIGRTSWHTNWGIP